MQGIFPASVDFGLPSPHNKPMCQMAYFEVAYSDHLQGVV